ncbi:unnamed protein product [Paramecium octaurelia]|uniref:Uncharacterized protein n=1 Tax=Paramecium octaurelia TaxID=43137 RepID=A0A8S1UG52_PAROT|nr:unnamed protein product [Paramecium octaurelia]
MYTQKILEKTPKCNHFQLKKDLSTKQQFKLEQQTQLLYKLIYSL